MEKERAAGVHALPAGNGKGLFASGGFKKGETILVLTGNLSDFPSNYSIQVGERCHLAPLSPGGGEGHSAWQYLNHSCEPNARVDTEKLLLIALRDIVPGDELTFNYNTTEFELTEPFECRCGAENCYETIRGYAFLNSIQKEQIAIYASGYLKRTLDSSLG